RAETIGVEGPPGAQLVASYPRARLDDSIDSIRLRVLVPMAILAGLVATIALFAADRISRVITDLSGRALALVDAPARPATGGDASEEVRMGTARGSRADRPMVVTAGSGIEGQALATGRPQVSSVPRAVLVVPIHREKSLLGVITVVDPEDGSFGSDDIET